MKPGSAKPADGRTSRQPSPSPLGRRPLGGEDRPGSTSRPTTPIRTRATRPNSPAKVGDAAVKPRGLGMRSWLRIDPHGDTQVIEADKYAIMRRCAIPARDLRILDPVLVYPSTILGREKAIVINLEHIKAIITAEEVLLQNYHNPYVEQFVAELQRRISSVRDPLTADPNFCSPPPSLPPPSQPLGQTPPTEIPSPKQAPKDASATDSVLLAPGLTASHGRSPSPAKKTTTHALKQQEHAPGERAKSPLGRASPSKKPTSPSRPPPSHRNEQRWQSLARENSLRGRSWSPVRRGAGRNPPPRGSTHSPEGKMARERVRSLSPLPRGRDPSRQSPSRGGASRPLSPVVQSERSTVVPLESTLWAPLAALKNRVFGRKKSYERLQSPDSDGRHMSPLPGSQVLFLEGGDAPGGGGFPGQAGSAHVVLPFEFRALEVILETVCGHLDVKSMELEQEAYPALDDLTVKIISANLERVRRFKSRLVGLSVRVQKVRDELEGLLDDDGDMREMYLTDKMLDALEPVSPDSTFTAGGFGSVMAGGSPHMSVPDPSRSRRQSTGGTSPTDQFAPGGSIPVPPPLDLSSSGPPASEAPTPRLGPIQPSILDVGFGPEAGSTGAAPQLSRELTFNPRAYEEHAANLARDGHLMGIGEPGQRDAQADVGMHAEAADQVSPLLRHFSGHSQRSLRRGRSRSRSRSGSRSRGSRSSTSRSSRSTKSSRKSGKGEDVEELEMLLEAYFAQIEGTLNKLSALREYIEDTEDYINIRLDDHQNQLLLLVIIITIGTVATTIAVVVSGVFGMNIKCSLYHDPKWFPVVMWSTLAACLACGIGIISWLKWRNLLSL